LKLSAIFCLLRASPPFASLDGLARGKRKKERGGEPRQNSKVASKNIEGRFEDLTRSSAFKTPPATSCKPLSLGTSRDLVKAAADNPSIADDVKDLLDYCGVERKPLSLGTSNELIKAAADHPSIADDVKALLDYFGVERKPLSLGTSNELIEAAADHPSIADDVKALFDYFGVEGDKFEPA
jgi:hypothetical protein